MAASIFRFFRNAQESNFAFRAAIVAIVALLVIPFGMSFLQTVENKLMPVFGNAKLIDTYSSGNRLYFKISVDKLRSCRPISITWYAGELKENSYQQLKLSGNRLSNNPVGPVVSEQQSVDLPANSPYQTHFGVVKHSCHPLWETTSILGPFNF